MNRDAAVALSLGLSAFTATHAQTAAAAAEPAGFVLEEVIVTARKRSESSQDVPISISTIGGAQLEKLAQTQLADYASYLPGLDLVGSGNPGTNVVILRGVFSGSLTAGAATVATYVDDTPVSSSSPFGGAHAALDLFPYDLERVEVLRGPQGTLYGSSAMGGLLKYVMKVPDLQEFETRVGMEASTIEGGDDLGWDVRTSINVPLIPGKLAARASYTKQSIPGFIDNALTGEKDENDGDRDAARIHILWFPRDDLSIKLLAVRETSDFNGNDAVAVRTSDLKPAFGDLKSSHFAEEPANLRTNYYAATVDWKLAGMDFISATSYSRSYSASGTDASINFRPALGLNVVFEGSSLVKKFTQELRLASSESKGPVDWIVGAFYTSEDGTGDNVATATDPASGSRAPAPFNPFLSVVGPFRFDEYAVFGDATYRYSDAFDVTAGVRWSDNRQDNSTVNSGFLFGPVPPPSTSSRSSEDVFTYMLSPRYRLNDDVMLYARVATGYRVGGPNVPLPGTPPTFDSDTVTNYELGLKTELLDRRALIDLAVYYIDWSDVQVLVQPNVLTYTGNAGSAVSQGVELTTRFSPVKGLQLGLNASYNKAELTEDVPTLPARDGDRIPRIPEWGASATADYEFPIGASLTGSLSGGYKYTGDRLSSFNANPAARYTFPSYDTVDLSAGIAAERWSTRLYVKNLTDSHDYRDNRNNGPGFVNLNINRPRTIGLIVDMQF